MPYKELMTDANAENSTSIAARVSKAREIQYQRFSRTKIFCNAQMNGRHMKAYCKVDPSCSRLLEAAVDKLGLSARGYKRILKIARTIADHARDKKYPGIPCVRGHPIPNPGP